MKKKVLVLVLAISILALYLSVLPACADENKWEGLIKESIRAFNGINTSPDQGIPKGLVYTAKAIAIFPNTVSGGIIVGIKKGQGVIVYRGKDGWSAPAVLDIDGGSLGFQFGVQESDIILVMTDDSNVEGLLKSKIKLGADVGVSAGPVGRDAQLSTDLQLKSIIYSYSKSRGVYIGAKLEGVVIAPNEDADKQLYGKDLTTKDIILKGKVKPTKAGLELIKTITEYTKK